MTGCEVVVDSSKLAAYGRLLETVPGLELCFVHLVRDPRAVAYSWARPKALSDNGSGGLMEQRSAFKTALLWDIANITAKLWWAKGSSRYLVVRYEDFAGRPRPTVERILAMVGTDGTPPPFGEDGTVLLHPDHSVAGNPDRLRDGRVRIKADDAWIEGLTRPKRALTTLITLPLLHHYRYPVLVGGQGARLARRDDRPR